MLTARVSILRLVVCVIFTLLAASAFAQADLAVTKTESPDPVVAGTNLTYTITLTNNGPSSAANVTLSDATPPSTTFVSASQTSGPPFVPSTPPVGGTGTFTATNSSFAVGTATFELTVHVGSNVTSNTPPFAIISTAAVTSTTSDPNGANDSDTETTSVITQADLSVTKVDSPDPVARGGNLTYTITLANDGPSDAQSVSLFDTVPANTTFVSFQQTSGPPFNLTIPVGGGGTAAATIATFAAGATATFELTVTVDAGFVGPSVSNTASAQTTTTDPNAANSMDTETTTVSPLPDLTITKNADDQVIAGNNLIYTLTLTNASAVPAANVSLSDTLPANTTFVSATQDSGPPFTLSTPPAGGTGTFSATIGSFAAGASATFTLIVRVDPDAPQASAIVNSATVSSSTGDATPANNISTATTFVSRESDLSVTKTDSPDPVLAGDDITYTIALTNNGPSDAQTVALEDSVPANTTFVSFVQNSGPAFTLISPPAGGTGTVTASSATMPAGTTATFTLVVNVNAPTPGGTVITNTAAVTTTFDSGDANDSDTETTAVASVPAPDVAVPTASTWMLIAFASMLGLAAVVKLRSS